MFGKIGLQYYLDENTYQAIYERFGLSKGNQKKQFYDSPITEISLLDIKYKGQFSHTYFFWITVDINLLYGMERGSYIAMEMVDISGFDKRLKAACKAVFGAEIENGISNKEYHYCTYIEYMAFAKTDDADTLMKKLRQGSFSDEQLDVAFFDSYKLKGSNIAFTINKIDSGTIKLCAKIPNSTALKRIFNVDSALVDGHIPHTKIEKVLDKEKAAEILYKQVVKYTKPDVPSELSREAVYAAL